jgi:hypothetical protein
MLTPGILIEIGEGHLAGSGVDMLDTRAPLVIGRAIGRRSIRQGDTVGLTGNGVALLVEEFDLNPVGFVLIGR